MSLLDLPSVPASLACLPGRVVQLWDSDSEDEAGDKRCNVCKRMLPFSEFPARRGKGTTYYRSQCKACYNEYALNLYHKAKARFMAKKAKTCA